MELGATVCTPSNPLCPSCPLQKNCAAFAHNEQNKLPVKQKQAPLPHYTVVAGIVFKDRKILIDKRKTDGLLGGLWEFPGGKKHGNESFKAAVAREVKEETGVDIEVGKRLCIVKHAYSHFKITLHAYLCQYKSGIAQPLACDAVKWIPLKDMKKHAFPGANQKIMPHLTSLGPL